MHLGEIFKYLDFLSIVRIFRKKPENDDIMEKIMERGRKMNKMGVLLLGAIAAGGFCLGN